MEKDTLKAAYKDFVQQLTKKTISEVYIIVGGDFTPNLRRYVKLLDTVQFKEGSYHTYFGQIRKIVASFLRYYEISIDKIRKEADEDANTLDRNTALRLLEETVGIHLRRQIEFGKEYLPVKSEAEKNTYEEVSTMYDDFKVKLDEFRSMLERFDRQERVDDFAKDHFKISVKKTCELFAFTHQYICSKLVDNVSSL